MATGHAGLTPTRWRQPEPARNDLKWQDRRCPASGPPAVCGAFTVRGPYFTRGLTAPAGMAPSEICITPFGISVTSRGKGVARAGICVTHVQKCIADLETSSIYAMTLAKRTKPLCRCRIGRSRNAAASSCQAGPRREAPHPRTSRQQFMRARQAHPPGARQDSARHSWPEMPRSPRHFRAAADPP